MKVSRWLILFFLILYSLDVSAQNGKQIHLSEQEVTLYYEDKGEGKALVFIPGWTMTTRFFSNQKEYFSKHYRFISYDPRSQGNSEKTISRNTYHVHAQDLHEFLEVLELKEIVLVGWSSGCITLFEYFKQFGTEHVSQFVFIDETPKWIGDSKTEWVYGGFEDYRGSLSGLLNTRKEDAYGIIDWMLDDPVDSLDKTWMVQEMMKTPNYAALSLFIDGMIADYSSIIKAINTTPPSVFFLRKSWYENAKVWLNNKAPSISTVRISSHAMFWERPNEFNKLLEAALASNQSK